MAVEKGNNWACTACHGQRTDTYDTAAEKSDDNARTVTKDTAPFISNMTIAAMF